MFLDIDARYARDIQVHDNFLSKIYFLRQVSKTGNCAESCSLMTKKPNSAQFRFFENSSLRQGFNKRELCEIYFPDDQGTKFHIAPFFRKFLFEAEFQKKGNCADSCSLMTKKQNSAQLPCFDKSFFGQGVQNQLTYLPNWSKNCPNQLHYQPKWFKIDPTQLKK